MSDLDYVKSIDNRLSKIEADVSDIRARLTGLTVKVASISAIIGAVVTAAIKWVI